MIRSKSDCFEKKYEKRTFDRIFFLEQNEANRMQTRIENNSYDIVEVFESGGRKQIILTSIENFILSLDRF